MVLFAFNASAARAPTEGPQKHSTHQIDCRGKLILQGTLPVEWSVNEQHSDYGIDFHIVLGESDGEQTGESLYVQLKSSVAPPDQSDLLPFLFETPKHFQRT